MHTNPCYIDHNTSNLSVLQKQFVWVVDKIHAKPKAEFNLDKWFYSFEEKYINLAKIVFWIYGDEHLRQFQRNH